MRANLPDLIIIGGVLMLGLASLMLGLTIGHLGLLLLAARALIGTLLELQQFGAGALYLSAPLAAALTEHAGLMLWAVQVLVAGFIWSFMAQAGVARWVHRVYGLFLLATLGLIAAPPGLAGPLVGIPFLVFTQLLNIHLIFRGYLPAVALLTGGITALAVNAPSMLGQPLGGVPRYVLSPLPLLLTLLLLLAVGWALHRERQQAAAALRDAQALALQGLEAEVAKRTAELQSARDEARRASQAKSVFLAKVSHELRTPLHALLGYLDLGLRQPLAPALQRQLSIARQAAQQLISQINDLLDHARSERTMLRLSPASLSLQSLALHLQNRMLLLAAERSNHFTLHCGPHLPAWVRADGSRLEQVLMALLSNAMRYTERGRVDLHITLAGPPATDGGLLAVSFMVEDNGPGIAPELLARLGQDFERGAAADGHGLGLGLAITRQLLALMDSQLVISSRLGSGSRFSFTLQLPRADEPLPPPLPPEPSARLAQPGRARRVLVLDDHAASRSYLAELLGATGLAVHGFAGVAEALAWLRACAEAGQAGPDLCIVDQHLGGLDSPARAGAPSGWYFIRGLHDLAPAGADGQACPVLMLSATAPRPPEGWAGETGIAGHLQKPVDPGLLLATVGELLALAWEPADGAGSGTPAAAGRSVGPAPMAGVVGSAGGAGTASWADPAGPSVAADAGAWQDLALLAESGSLSGLYEWAAAHPGLLAADAVLQSLIDRLDFAGIARRALRALDT